MLVTALSAKYIKPAPAVVEDLTVFRMVHPTKGKVRADSRSAPGLEKLGYRAIATPPQGSKKKG